MTTRTNDTLSKRAREHRTTSIRKKDCIAAIKLLKEAAIAADAIKRDELDL